MDDLISRQAAIDYCYQLINVEHQQERVNQTETILHHLEFMQSAQPEIIRCKDCRYYQDNNDGYLHINCKWDANETPDADDFCSGAERRTDE